jgi:hypothetical protein
MFEGRLLNISGPKREELRKGLRKLHNEGLHFFFLHYWDDQLHTDAKEKIVEHMEK